MFTGFSEAMTAFLSPEEIRHETSRLEHEISRLMQQLSHESRQLQEDQAELEAFTNAYYRQVADVFRKLETVTLLLESEQRKAGIKAELPVDNLPPSIQPSRPAKTAMEEKTAYFLDGYETEMKRLYRTLARHCHPDTAINKTSAGKLFQYLSQAYQEKNYLRLKQMEQILTGKKTQLPPGSREYLMELSGTYHTLLTTRRRLQDRKAQLKNSSAWKLLQRVKSETLRGNDLIADIRLQLKTEILHREKTLALLRIRHCLTRLGGTIRKHHDRLAA